MPDRDRNTAPLVDDYDVLLLDLDGTVYRGAEAIPGAVEALAQTAGARMFVTNNASRRAPDVAEKLRGMGVAARPDQVITSAQAAAVLLAHQVPAGSTVLVLGAPALSAEVVDVGLAAVERADQAPVAVVQGFDPDLGWRRLAEGALAVRSGALWVASNIDTTLPSERGLLPGNGSLVAVVRTATGQEPIVAGKPSATIMEQAATRAAAERPLAVGDRLDTDIAGAVAAGIDALLVLTGVSSPADVLRAGPAYRPRYIAADMSALHRPAARSAIGPQRGWTVRIDGDRMTVLGTDSPAGPEADLDWVRSAAGPIWARIDRGECVPTIVAGDERAAQALAGVPAQVEP